MSQSETRSPRPSVYSHQRCVNNSNTVRDSPQTNGSFQVVQSGGKARLQCHACNRLLEYDAGAQYVQCFSCSTMNAVQAVTQLGGRVLSMLCAICHTTNLAPYGINYVRCGACSTISQVSHAYNNKRLQNISSPGTPRSTLSTPQRHEKHILRISSGPISPVSNNVATTSHPGLQDGTDS